ncbi:MAG: flavodoxin domain-containing protein [Actinomycetota bacterium]
MRIVVLSQSRTGNTRRAAEMIGGSAEATGAEVSVHAVTEIDYDALGEADLVMVGTWVGGLFFFGHHPGDAGVLNRELPMLHDTPVAAFMTYAHYAGKVMKRYSKLLERKGMDVVATELLRADLLPQGVDAFVDRAIEAVGQRSTT